MKSNVKINFLNFIYLLQFYCEFQLKKCLARVPFVRVKKVDDNGVVTLLYEESNANSNKVLSLLGVTPNGVIAYTLKNELVVLSGGAATTLDHNIISSPLPRITAPIGKSTNTLVYFEALDTINSTLTEAALWVTDGTLLGTKKVISNKDYYSGVISFDESTVSRSVAVCGNDIYFAGQKTLTSQFVYLYFVNGANLSYTIDASFQNPSNLIKLPSGIFMKGGSPFSQYAIYKTSCSGNPSVINENISNEIAFDLFPNPSNGSMTVKVANNIANAKLTVYNVVGELLYNEKLSGQSTVINLNFNAGLYFISLDNNGQKTTKKIIVE